MIRAIIADDSPFLREVLTDVLEHKQIKIIAQAKNGKEAVAMVKSLKPDILILDCEMPVMNGLDALRIIMKDNPLPVFMFSSLTWEGAAVTIKALEAGAVDFMLKPTGGAHNLEEVAEDLVQKIKFIVMKSRFAGIRKGDGSAPADASHKVQGAAAAQKPEFTETLPRRAIDLIAMGSSTGGVHAAGEIIPKLPANMKPIVWVQHMPPNFTKSFAERLNSISKMKVVEAKDGDQVLAGTCYLAPGGIQMRVVRTPSRTILKVAGNDKVSGHCPSCNVLFGSVSEHYRENALGIILTGMGDDGTEGLVKMHEKGSYVIAQSEDSCVVYGMPKAAYLRGAVDIHLDLMKIAEGVSRVTGIAQE